MGLKIIDRDRNTFTIEPGKKVVIAIAAESKFKQPDPLEFVLSRLKKMDRSVAGVLMAKHDAWWQKYWGKSSVSIGDTTLMKAYYQGLYTMAACSRDPRFPPGLFEWVTTDDPQWAGDWWENNGLGTQHIYPCNAITLDSDDELLALSRNTIDDE